MMFSPHMTVALRVIALKRNEGWLDGQWLAEIHGIRRTTLRALVRAGVLRVRVRVVHGCAHRDFCLTPLAIAIIDAVRA